MPLPDATKDKRIYQLLKNIDLGNLTFSEFQTAAQSVFAEPEAEDTLRRIVLVNLARMSVAGDWAGLTSAGGGGSGYGVLRPQTTSGTFDGFEVCSMAPWGVAASSYSPTAAAAYPQGYPFVSPKSGDVARIEVYCSTASASSTVKVAIYAQDETTHMPSTMLGYVDLDSSSTGTIAATSFTGGTPTLVAGTQYWIVQARGSASYGSFRGVGEDARLGLGMASDPTNGPNCQANFVGDWNAANPVDNVGTLSQYVSGDALRVLLKWA
jgi:hypothetical protein